MRVFSFGGGVQSVATLILQVQGKLSYDAFVFANVGEDSENPATLEYLEEFVKPLCAAQGIAFAEVRKTRFGKPDSVYQSAIRPNRSIPIPVKLPSGAFGNRTCTQDFKVKVVDKWIREQGVTQAVMGIGFSADEGRRIEKKPKGWHDHHGKYKFGFQKKFEFPLATLGLRRSHCHQIITDFGLPTPEASLCWFCPFSTRARWIELKKNEPEQFQRALAMEQAINEKRGSSGRNRVYLHRDGYALDFLSQEARRNVTDALHAHFHNEWSALEGNTEESDVEWFARTLHETDFDDPHHCLHWDGVPDEVKEKYRHMARLSLRNLPAIASRIANRYKAIRDALDDLVKRERDELYKHSR